MFYNKDGDIMRGIDLNSPIKYEHASLRFFNKNEHHITRFCENDVLLLVYDGILRFSEDGVEYEVYPGNYHIQKKNTFQKGDIVSEAPKYLYVHFKGEWKDDNCLPYCGEFNYNKLKPLIEKMNSIAHSNSSYIEKTTVFYEILLNLRNNDSKSNIAHSIGKYISDNINEKTTLEMLSEKFHFSKNQIINIIKKEYNMTPFEYMNNIKIMSAEHQLEVTSETAEKIALDCGFYNYSHFYRLFYRKNGISPSEWRKLKRIKP